MSQYQLLNDADLPALVEATLVVLEQVGVLCQNAELLEALAAWGAVVDRENEIARFPRTGVERFVEGLQTEYRRNGEPATPKPFPRLPSPALGTQVAQFVYDYKTGEKRPGNKQDFVDFIKFGDVLSGGHVGHCLLLAEVPPILEPLEAGLLLAEYAHEPGPPFAWNARQVEYLVEMGDILGRENWFTWGALCFAHPLRLDKDVADRFVPCVRSGGSAGFTAMPVPGMTTPITTAGFIVVSAAELISSWIAGRALNPHCPLYGSMWGGSLDMHTSTTTYSAFDGMRGAFATREFLRKWTGVVINAGGGEYCTAKHPGYFAAWEKAHKAMTIAAFTGEHPGIGQGMLEDGKTLCLVQLLLERELAEGVRLYSKPVDVSPETIGLDTILRVGFGLTGSYMDQDHTLEHFRDDTWLPETLDRSGYAGPEWEKRVLDRLQRKVEELLGAYRKPTDRDDRLAELRILVDRARRELLG